MRQFIKHFIREADGSWRCVDSATIDTPAGRIQVTAGALFTPGTSFMGCDLVEMLDEESALERGERAQLSEQAADAATMGGQFPDEPLRGQLVAVGIPREQHERQQLVRRVEALLGEFKHPQDIDVNDLAHTLVHLVRR